MSHAAPANGEAAVAAPIRSTLDADGLLLATIDMPGRTILLEPALAQACA